MSQVFTLEPGDLIYTGTPPASASRASHPCISRPGTSSKSRSTVSASCAIPWSRAGK
ncbi:MAG: hypothetical protein U0793_09000 [Gemmataceae bacterium]